MITKNNTSIDTNNIIIDSLLNTLKCDESDIVRKEAVIVLSRFISKCSDIVTHMIESFERDKSSIVWTQIVTELVKTVKKYPANPKNPEIINVILKWLYDDNNDKRCCVIFGLKQLKYNTPNIINALLYMIGDYDIQYCLNKQFQCMIIEVLNELGLTGDDIINHLIRLLLLIDNDNNLKYKALRSLYQLKYFSINLTTVLLKILKDCDVEMGDLINKYFQFIFVRENVLIDFLYQQTDSPDFVNLLITILLNDKLNIDYIQTLIIKSFALTKGRINIQHSSEIITVLLNVISNHKNSDVRQLAIRSLDIQITQFDIKELCTVRIKSVYSDNVYSDDVMVSLLKIIS